MEKVYENLNKYGEEMKGKFSHNPYENGIVISVTSPFVKEIHIECDKDVSGKYYSTYSLLKSQADHPEGYDRLIYYNTQEKCYYRSEWGPKEPELKESEWGYIWVKTGSKYIIDHAQLSEKLQAHFRIYDNIHKGQLCVFIGYAVDPNGQYKRPSTVESMFDRHKWFYNPWSFRVSLLNGDTIDDFVEETPISKEMTDKMVLYHKKQYEDREAEKIQKQNQEKKDKRKAAIDKVEDHLSRREKIYRYLVFGGVLYLLGTLANLIWGFQ